MAYQHKVIFCIRDEFEYGFGWIPMYPLPSHTCVFKLGLVRTGNHMYEFCYHAY